MLVMYSKIDLSTKINKVSVVSKEFYGLPAEFYGPQRFIEIKNNSLKCFIGIKVAETQSCIHMFQKYLWHRNPQKLKRY